MSRASIVAGIAAMLLLVAGVLSWQEQAPTARAAGSSGTALDGSVLFRAKGCAMCHTGPDTTRGSSAFPDLSDAASWAGRRQPGVSAEAYLEQSIREPGIFFAPSFEPSGGPVTGMPTLAVSDAEVAALVAYLLGR